MPQKVDTARLGQWLNATVSSALPQGEVIVKIEWDRSRSSSSYECYVVEVRLNTARSMRLFLKDLGYSRTFKSEPDRRREREILTYRDLLVDANLGTPAYFGSTWNDQSNQHWLLLEFVEGMEVRSLPMEYWIATAGWLGRLHGKFSQEQDRLARSTFLLRHDAHDYEQRAHDALANATAVAPALSAQIGRIVSRFEQMIPDLTAPVPTLVHGSMKSSQVIVDTAATPPRIAPVDWESASWKSGYQDLAMFTDGFTRPLLDEMFQAYMREARDTGLLIDPHELRHTVGCFRMLRVVNRLSQSKRKGYLFKDVAKVLKHGESILEGSDESWWSSRKRWT